MSRAAFTLFDDNRAIHQSNLPAAGNDDLLTHSGLVASPIILDNLQKERTLWVCVGSRNNKATVTIVYVAETHNYEVTPGHPLILETLNLSEGADLLSVTITPQTGGATLEVLIYPGEENVLPPLAGEFLVLNAAAGVIESPDGKVESWQDVRVSSGAPGLFTAIGDQGPINAPSNRFNDQPVILFADQVSNDNIDTRLQYQGSVNDFAFLATGDFTIAMTVTCPDIGTEQQIVSNEKGTSGGMLVAVDGGLRTTHRRTDDAGTINNEDTDLFNELALDGAFAPRPFALIARYTAGVLKVYRQGTSIESADAGALATSVIEELTLGGQPFAVGAALFQGDIADLRIWDRAIADIEQLSYLSFAATQYATDDTAPSQGKADANLLYYLRASRGVTSVDGDVTLWEDTRPEITLGAMGPATGPAAPQRWSGDTLFGGQYIIEFINAQLEYNGPIADFDFLAGSSEWTMLLVLRSLAVAPNEEILIHGDDNNNPGPYIKLYVSAEIRGETYKSTTRSGLITNYSAFVPGEAARMYRFRGAHTEGGAVTVNNIYGTVKGNGLKSENNDFINAPENNAATQALLLGSGACNYRLAEIRIFNSNLSGALAEHDDYLFEHYGIVPS